MNAHQTILFCLLPLLLGSGCATSRRRRMPPPAPLPPPVLAPAMAYPAEKTGWNCGAPLMFRPQEGLNNRLQDVIRESLSKRGYTLVAAPDNEYAWMSAENRQRTKLLHVIAIQAIASREYDKKRTGEICAQIEVVDQAFDGDDFDSSNKRSRIFVVWGRADLMPSDADDLGMLTPSGYERLFPAVAQNLMCMPVFRKALEPDS